MTKQEFIELFDSVIDGRTGYSVEIAGGNYIHVYSEDNAFTASLITRVVEMTKGYFTGVVSDTDGRPYLLFTI